MIFLFFVCRPQLSKSLNCGHFAAVKDSESRRAKDHRSAAMAPEAEASTDELCAFWIFLFELGFGIDVTFCVSQRHRWSSQPLTGGCFCA
jgi:hypothetical protein